MSMADVQPSSPEPDTTGAAEETCRVCPHPWEGHDKIAKRFCTAMGVSGDLRKCLCSGVSAGMTYSNSTRGPISG
ncbi:RGCVC family protein [Umezawaea tangerina]|uniref:Uncharacterized protein n=1 Tax=Umezawaea tangerina TaxID=84725 RepID=A0A2T0THP6_9PSEU|nr:RGCVC family protein [Umezawaea tangerina]PRY45135.1 hypothetical protein CLV43_102700 [Umezawaea tangerina]